METTNQTTNIYSAFAKAQAQFATPKKTRKAAYGYYADLQQIFSCVKPALAQHGLGITQSVESVEGGLTVETILVHESGASMSSGKLFMPVKPAPKMNDAQAFGSAETYARRYSLSAFLGIASDDDDDGNYAGTGSAQDYYTNHGKPTPPKPKAPQQPAPQEQHVKEPETQPAFEELSPITKDILTDAAKRGTPAFREAFKELPSGQKVSFKAGANKAFFDFIQGLAKEADAVNAKVA